MANKAFQARLDDRLHELLRRHSFQRNVSINQLVSDVLTLWVLAAHEEGNPLFDVELPTIAQRHAGYLTSLGFQEEEK